MLPDEASGFAPEPEYVSDLAALLPTFTTDLSTDRVADLVANTAITEAALRESEAEIHRLEEALAQAVVDREQGAALVPDPDEVVVSRGDAALLAVLADEDERPAVKAAVVRVLAAVGTKEPS